MKTLKQKLVAHLEANGGWHASGSLQRLEWRNDKDGTVYTAANVSRRCRELAEDGKIAVEQRKGHAHYAALSTPPQRKPRTTIEFVEVDGVRVAREVLIS